MKSPWPNRVAVDAADPELHAIVRDGAPLGIVADGFRFCEGPVWDARHSLLRWVDIVGDTIWRCRPGAPAEIEMRPSHKANGLTLDHEGRLLAAGWGWRCVWRRSSDGAIGVLCSSFDGVRLNSPNDLVVHPDGSIYFTDPSGALNNVGMGEDDVQRYLDFHGVYRISPDGRVDLVARDFVYPNGLAFSSDGSRLFINDTRENLIRVFDVAQDGSLVDGKLFATLAGDGPGRADGMKLDRDGRVYCTGPGGVHVFAADGRHLGRIRTPDHPTNLAFGGPQWRTLFVTTHRAVFSLPVDVPGLPSGPHDTDFL